MKLILKMFLQITKIVPYSSGLTVFAYVCFAVLPGLSAYITSTLFQHVYSLSESPDAAVKPVILGLGVAIIVIYFVKNMMSAISSVTVNMGVYEKVTHALNISLSEKASKLAMIDFENANILNDFKRAQECVANEIIPQIFMMILNIASAGLGIAGVAVVLSGYHSWFIPLCVLSVAPFLIVRLIRGNQFYKLKWFQAKRTRQMAYLWGLFNQSRTVKEMRTFGFDHYITDKWEKVRDEVNEERWEFIKKDSLSLLLCEAIKIMGYIGSLVLAFVLTVQGEINIGVFGTCIVAFNSIQEQMKALLTDMGRLPERMAFAHDYYHYLELLEEESGEIPFLGLRQGIQLSDVTFTYPHSSTPSVKKVTLHIKKGEKVAIVGENGSGKTTLSKLILGLYPCGQGQVTYDGVDLNTVDKRSFYASVSAISQQPVPYHFTVRENVAMGPGLQPECDVRIHNLLDNVGLLDAVEVIGGIDRTLGKEFGGAELSGGGWQKMAITRALYKDSSLVLLDEPTSAIDPIMETEILSHFLELAVDKTAIIISHRVGLCKHVDQVIVMKHGEVVEAGSHEQLMSKRNEYYRLYTSQQKWYE